MANFPGSGNANPGPYSEVVTLSRGVSVPNGVRVAAIMGEGSRQERLIGSAVGGGRDGLNASYSSANGADGRHFILSTVPIVPNRTTLFKNGIPLALLEGAISSSPFNSKYDARIDTTNGHIELQTASLVDQGGSTYSSSALNVGTGTINGLTLVDLNAPTESWSIRCTSVRRDTFGNPIDGYARFVVQGTVSGIILDGYGNQIIWQSNGTVTSNTVLQFSITEGSTKFHEGDRFTIQVKSGALVKGDSLTATYIGVADINDPEFFTDQNSLVVKHGSPSLTNRLSLGAQLAFENTPPGVLALECAPSVPRRLSYSLVSSATGGVTIDDLSFPLPLGVVPDVDSNVHFFVTDPVTKIESQILPNKFSFYDPTTTASPNTFVFGGSHVYTYTVVMETAVEKQGTDGVLTSTGPTTATLSSSTVTFGLDDLSGFRSLKIYDATNPANNGTFSIVSIARGVMTISSGGGFVAESNIRFEVLDSSDQSARILFTEDLALSLGQSLRVTVVDEKDATFFDVGWEAALSALEKVDLDILVPLPSQTISAIFAAAKSHVETMSQIKNKRERALFIGAIQGLTPDNVTGVSPAAVEDIGVLEGIQGHTTADILAGNIEDLTDYGVPNSYGNSIRVVYFYPDQIVVSVGGDNTLVDGFFIAAAAAGYLSGVANVAVPLTNKTLAGFTILRDRLFAPITLENLSAAGICTLQPALGGGSVIWGKTTTQSGFPEEEEISILFIRDRISKSMRAGVKGFIGNPESDSFPASLFTRVDGLMKSFISGGLITAYQDLVVKRNAVDPRQWDVTAAVMPVYPINWIYIRVNLGVI